ncbi:peptidase S8/S53 domain-containing protein [Irpex lacteus]|nr:peptidase S8/S53 domain-containing protein [Irpex lacteus]
MRFSSLLLAALVQQSVFAARPVKRNYDTHNYYVLELNPSGHASLDECAGALGVELVERAGELDNHFLVRTPKSPLEARSEEDRVLRAYETFSNEHSLLRTPGERNSPPPIRPPSYDDSPTAQEVAEKLLITDPEFPQQWHLNMMNGITGKGVISTFVDDGLDYNSDDLATNFYAAGSHDFNDHEDLPTPKLFDDHHGTRCAGQVAAVKNDVCGVGIAYDSKVAGVRILSGPISDVDEAAALNFGYQESSIFSCSWGPPDDGRSMEGPGYLIKKAMVNGIQNGRGGLGSIFVFASGNGGRNGDQCNFDGYTNSIFSITVASIDYKGLHPDYSEACAANMVVAYSSGSGNHIVTTDIGKNKCSHGHGGTSAAAPNAAGIFALALQARPYSYKYGYGALSGEAFVDAAMDWQSVKPQAWIKLPTIQVGNGTMDLKHYYEGITSKMTVSKETLESHNFEKLEHITVKVWITHSRRGDVEVELVSPSGVKSILAARRSRDSADTGFPAGNSAREALDPVGEWTIRRQFLGWTMTVWGSVIDAQRQDIRGSLIDEPSLLSSLRRYSSPAPTSSAIASTKTHPNRLSTCRPITCWRAAESPVPTPSSTPTADEGWFSDLSKLLTNQVWFFVASAQGDGYELYGRKRRGHAVKGALCAFDEEDDDEDADEETGLRRAPDHSPVGLGYHSGFLDDDDPLDEPSPTERAAERSHNSGSWEHASQDNAPRS